MFNNFRKIYHKFPKTFWVLILTTLIDSFGYTLVFPFFSLYITGKFNVGMTVAGSLMAIFAFSGLLGILAGGAMADKMGRRKVIVIGLIFSALSSIMMGLINDLSIFYGLAIIVGFLSNFGSPAREALVIDLVGEEDRAEAFGIIRVVANISWVIGPIVAGFLATSSYLFLFILDAITSIVVAGIFLIKIPETLPAIVKGISEKISFLSTLEEYRILLKDNIFNLFLLFSVLINFVYLQLLGALPVYLRDTHGFSPKQYGFLMSLNALIVVLFQIWISSKTKNKPPMKVLALGAFTYVIAFPIFGFASSMIMFSIAVILITIGEMIMVPVGSALVAKFASEDMRGRYMAIFELSWNFPSIIAPILAGLVMDKLNPTLLWTICGGVAMAATLGYYGLHGITQARFKSKGN